MEKKTQNHKYMMGEVHSHQIMSISPNMRSPRGPMGIFPMADHVNHGFMIAGSSSIMELGF